MPASSQQIEKQIAEGLAQVITRFLEDYFAHHKDTAPPPGLYERVIREIERPLLQVTLKFVGGNQKKAAELLGINRNTLRKKLNNNDILVERT